MKPRLLIGSSLAALVLALAQPVGAATNVSLPATAAANTNYYAMGQTVEIKGDVASDVLVAGGNVTITGSVGGDVLVVGGNVRISGPVTGNVRILSGQVELAGSVGHNVLVAAGSVKLDSTSQVLGHVTVAAGSLALGGMVEGSVTATATDIKITGNIKGPIELWLGRDGTLEVAASAVTGAEFRYHAANQAQVAPGAKLALQPELKPLLVNTNRGRDATLAWLVVLFGSLVLGLVAVGVFPKKLLEVAQEALAHPWGSLGRGALWAVAIPIVAILLVITLIGLPLAGVLLALYVIGGLVTQVVVGATLGWWLRSQPQLKFMQTWSTLVLVTIGLVLYRLLTLIPWVGVLLSLFATLWAWGALVQVQRRTIASFR